MHYNALFISFYELSSCPTYIILIIHHLYIISTNASMVNLPKTGFSFLWDGCFAKGDFNDIIKGIEAFGVILQHGPEEGKC